MANHVAPLPSCTQYLVLSTQCFLLAANLGLVGCNDPNKASVVDKSPAEASLQDQLQAVQRGTSTRIEIESQPVRDEELRGLADLKGLIELKLDHQGSNIAGGWSLLRLPDLMHFRYRGAGIDDEALGEIVRGCPKLRIVNIPRGDLTDAGLAELKQLPNLIQLRFGSPRVTDAGMKTLAELPALKRLHLIDVPITDVGLAELAKIEQLESLYMDGGKISDDAWDKLFRQRPKLHVHINQEHHDRDPHKHPH